MNTGCSPGNRKRSSFWWSRWNSTSLVRDRNFRKSMCRRREAAVSIQQSPALSVFPEAHNVGETIQGTNDKKIDCRQIFPLIVALLLRTLTPVFCADGRQQAADYQPGAAWILRSHQGRTSWLSMQRHAQLGCVAGRRT